MSLETEIFENIMPDLKNLGYDLVQIKIRPGIKGKRTLELLISREDDTPVSIGDCKKVNNAVSTLLEVEDLIKGEFNLEVSSAGLERPLIKLDDYKKYMHRCIKIKVNEAIDSHKVFVGNIDKIEESVIFLKIKDDGKIIGIEFDNIKSGNIVLTDELFKELLNKG